MRHAYVVMDNDAPLFVCLRQEQAERIAKQEKERLYVDLIGFFDDPVKTSFMAPAQIRGERQRAMDQYNKHFIHYLIVPFAPVSPNVEPATSKLRGQQQIKEHKHGA